MSAEGVKEVTLDCGESGVELNETTPVSFFIALPPVQFEGGFTITVTDTWGGSKEYSTSKKNPVGRSKGLRMPAKEYIGVRPPQEGDYIDEYGVNHGQGIEIDGIVWAPVNCGYKKDDYPYGKYYQWGRKYGLGLDRNSTRLSPVSYTISLNQEKANLFYICEAGDPFNWCSTSKPDFWNEGTEGNPVKTVYDPCPEGWRVPTNTELCALTAHYSSKTTNGEGQNG